MAIGKLLPRIARRYAPHFAYRPDRKFAAGKLGHLCGLGCQRRSVFENIRGLVTPPLPFAGAERKAGPNRLKHNTVPGKLPTAQIGLFAAPEVPGAWLRLGRLKPEGAGAARAERLLKCGKDCFEFPHQRPRWIDDKKTRRGEGGACGLWRDAELQTQAFSGRRGGAGRLGDMP